VNATRDRKERFSRLLLMHANKREDVKEIGPGDIVAAVGLKFTTTGDTLCTKGSPVILESMDFPDPVIDVAIEPRTKADQDKLGEALSKLSMEDPTFSTRVDPESGQLLLSGMGELHLEILVDRLKREYKVEAKVGKPMVSYRETVTASAAGEAKFVRQAGGRGQYGHVILEVSPLERGGGFEFDDTSKVDQIPREFQDSVRAGIEESLERGQLADFPMTDVKVVIKGGSFHEVDSSEVAFKVAAAMAFADACGKASPVLMEPHMELNVTVPEEYLGAVIGDLNARRGKVGAMNQRGGRQIVDAEVPLSELFGYVGDLRSITQGRGDKSMQFCGFQPCPRTIQDAVVQRLRGGY
jgi:elongation factor G